MRRYFKWEEGRQKSGYAKMLLAESSNRFLPFDAYLLHYPTGSEITAHSDSVKGGRHVRINLVLKKARKGGVFSCEGRIFGKQRLNIFYSDLPHHVSKIEEGTRILLSIGILIKNKKPV